MRLIAAATGAAHLRISPRGPLPMIAIPSLPRLRGNFAALLLLLAFTPLGAPLAQQPSIDAWPWGLNAADIVVGSSGQYTFTVKNDGALAADVNLSGSCTGVL